MPTNTGAELGIILLPELCRRSGDRDAGLEQITGQRLCDGRKAACAVDGKVTLTISPLVPPALTRTCASGKRCCSSSTPRTNRAAA
jgi:hypothetical protein